MSQQQQHQQQSLQDGSASAISKSASRGSSMINTGRTIATTTLGDPTPLVPKHLLTLSTSTPELPKWSQPIPTERPNSPNSSSFQTPQGAPGTPSGAGMSPAGADRSRKLRPQSTVLGDFSLSGFVVDRKTASPAGTPISGTPGMSYKASPCFLFINQLIKNVFRFLMYRTLARYANPKLHSQYRCCIVQQSSIPLPAW
jgi:hypothetical protein